jgi:hypothetical protein
LFANKNFTFTDQDYETEVIMNRILADVRQWKKGMCMAMKLRFTSRKS